MNPWAAASLAPGHRARAKIELALLGKAIDDREHLTAQLCGYHHQLAIKRFAHVQHQAQ